MAEDVGELYAWLVDMAGETGSPFESRKLMAAAEIIGERIGRSPHQPDVVRDAARYRFLRTSNLFSLDVLAHELDAAVDVGMTKAARGGA